jgi:SAM-dependent methyltransferase
MSNQDNTTRFTGRVEAYARYRPGYPAQLLALLRDACGLTPRHRVADIGSGTCKLSELFLANGHTVYCVEPNAEMRAAAEGLLGGTAGFVSVDGKAEATGLSAQSVDLVTAGQAFHWFDPEQAREEFRRILRPGGHVVLVWNSRVDTASPFMQAYDAFLREYSVDYGRANHRRTIEGDGIRTFFRAEYATASFPNPRSLDFPSLWGAYLSATYAFTAGHPRYDEARERLRAIVDEHGTAGVVQMPMVTEVHHGTL